MPTVTFENGQSVNFDKTPSPADIEEVATKLNIQKSTTPENPTTPETPKTFGDQPTFPASIGGANTVIPNTLKTLGNIPSDAANILKTSVDATAGQIGQSVADAKDIYQTQGAVQGTKNIASGFADTAAKIAEAPGKLLVGTNDKLNTLQNLTPIQQDALKQRDTILQKLQQTKAQGKDTTHLALALKYNTDTLGSLADQIGTPESRTANGVNTVTNVAKYPIEHPVQATMAVQQTGQQLGIKDPIHSIASPIINKGESLVKPIGTALTNYYKQKEIDTFAKPTTIPKASYNKATDIYNNSKGKVGETLVNNGIKNSDIIDKGVYNTSDTADTIRADAGKMSNETLRPALQQADYSTPKTPVEDVIKKTIKDLNESRGVTPGDIESQIAKAKAEGEILKQKYPNGMSLTDMHDNKITYAMNGKYSPIGISSENNIASTNRAFGRTLGDLVEEKAPSDIPVHDFNAELQKQYQAADYLDALHGKKAPLGLGSRIAKTSAKVAGAAIGEHLGGGLLGGVGGYHLGGMLETSFENMSNPVKSYFLKNLQTTNPEAFSQIQKYLGDSEVQRLLTPQLAAPSEATALGSDKNPLITPSPTTYEKSVPRTDYSKNSAQIGSVKNPTTSININNNIPNTVPETSNLSNQLKSLPTSRVNKTIEDHISSAEQVLSELPKSELNKQGGIDKLLQNTVKNISMQLKSQGYTDIAKQLNTLKISSIKSVDDLQTAVLKITKGI